MIELFSTLLISTLNNSISRTTLLFLRRSTSDDEIRRLAEPFFGTTLKILSGRSFLSGCNGRSEEHTSELQSLRHLVCRLLLEKKKRRIRREIAHVKLRVFASEPDQPDAR